MLNAKMKELLNIHFSKKGNKQKCIFQEKLIYFVENIYKLIL